MFKRLLAIIFPSHCLGCDKIISKDSFFCHECFGKLEFISNPKCPICSYPFEVDIKQMQPLCGSCLKKKPAYDKLLAIFRYNHLIKKIIKNFKYHDQTFLAKKLAKIIWQHQKEEILNCDLLIPIPIHKNKLKKRKFNQCALIAKELLKLAKRKQINSNIIFKIKDTKPQNQLKKEDRIKNQKKAFLTNQKYRSLIKNKKILLIDDVVTTGSTIENCSRELKKRGALKVSAVTIAKTVF